MQSFDRMAGRGVIDDDFYDELEEALLQADTNVRVTQQILDELREAVRRERITDPAAMRLRLQQAIAKRFEQEGAAGLEYSDDGPSVFVFVGVNGVGKTTTIAKVANFLTTKGFSVIMAAGDTFRAAAIEQLEVWAQRTGSQIVRNQPGGDSAAVLFDAISAAKARNIDFVLADTAGRQHSKGDLMNELQKVVKTAEKALGRKPDEILLVLDANTGQNAIRQAEEFKKAAAITGIVLTKIDGTARGGALIGVYDQLRIPIKLVGTGEKVGDLLDFKPERFAAQMFE
ncbi:signal recognition particle-docking protein FtsY [bacterium]|nr:MAG: signal recognition particle-docking protein FtsY [bacterium]